MSTELYTEYYGLSERPFTLLPDPDFLFWSKAHKRAYTVLQYGLISRAPLTIITGEVGAGKTTLVQALLKTLDDNITIGLISNAQGGRGELLRWALNALSVPHDPNSDYVALHQTMEDFAIEEYAAGRRVVLIIDEAQNLSVEGLEELRMLTNINSNKDELLQLILIGQPELREMIQRPSLRQFAQRVAAAYHIKPMDLDTTREYIRHRLRHVGGTGFEFRPAALTKIYDETGGVPRLVNKLCDLAMVYAAGDDKKTISVELIAELIEDQIFVNTDNPAALLLDSAVDHPGAAAE